MTRQRAEVLEALRRNGGPASTRGLCELTGRTEFGGQINAMRVLLGKMRDDGLVTKSRQANHSIWWLTEKGASA